MASYIVVYDSCILYSFTLRNLFVELAMAELFQAKWTNEINNEWIEALLKNGSRKKFIAERYGITQQAFINWCRKHNIDDTPRP